MLVPPIPADQLAALLQIRNVSRRWPSTQVFAFAK